LLSMSAAIADRLLSSLRKLDRRGLSTTRAETLLKQQIPIRTSQEWRESHPCPAVCRIPVQARASHVTSRAYPDRTVATACARVR
jgi:hypothetical protein